MADTYLLQEAMLEAVARALGDDLLKQVAFVGGCTTALMLSDEFTKEAVRATDDVDLIVNVLGLTDWNAMLVELRQRGFRESPEDDVICRMRLTVDQHELIVDFMPDDEKILGFTNRWYKDALRSATYQTLASGTAIPVITPAYFIATKLEAFKGRGNNDPISSRDIEDILNVVDGREELAREIADASDELRSYIADEIKKLLALRDFDYAVQAAARNQTGRDEILFQRLEALTNL
jgi:predicted nucleotidyltransferase